MDGCCITGVKSQPSRQSQAQATSNLAIDANQTKQSHLGSCLF
jgi:hypothetical protein